MPRQRLLDTIEAVACQLLKLVVRERPRVPLDLEGEASCRHYRVQVTARVTAADDTGPHPGVGPVTGPGRIPDRLDLAGHFFSEREAEIVRVVSRGCYSSDTLPDHVNGGKNKSFTQQLAACLCGRGVLRAGERGYEITDPYYLELAVRDSNRTG